MHPATLLGAGGRKGVPTPYNGIPSLCWLLRGDSIAHLPGGTFLHSWRDESGQKHHMHQHHAGAAGAVGYQPQVDQTNLLNGHPGVLFTGTYGGFFIANDRLLFGDNITMFFVLKNDYVGSSVLMDFGGGDPRGTVHNLWIDMGSICQVNWYYNDPVLDLSGVVTAGNYVFCFEVYLNPTANIEAWINGSHQTPATSGNTNGIGYGVPSTTYGAGGSWDDPDVPRIGVGGAPNSANNFQGTIYEVAFFNEVLSSGNRSAVESYLQAKYGL